LNPVDTMVTDLFGWADDASPFVHEGASFICTSIIN